MLKRLKTLIFILALSISVFSGTPLHGGNMKMKDNACAMKCCKKKAKSSDQKKNAEYLCRVFICSQSMPTHTSSTVQINLAPVIIASEKITLFEILFATSPKEDSPTAFKQNFQHSQFLPKYIRHQQILI